MRAAILFCFGVLVLCVGCQRAAESNWLEPPHQGASNRQAMNNVTQFGLAVEAEERVGPAEDGKKRKLVYHAEVDTVVDELSSGEEALSQLVKEHEGIVANVETVSRSGSPRTGVWRLRIPVARFDAFLKALGEIGEVKRNKLDVQDVTRSHSELEEQIRNLEAEVAGLRELLKKPSDKLADTLAVREQLSKVTREMEGLKARLRRMQAKAEYSTVTLRMMERSGALAGSATPLRASAARAFWDSCEALVAFGRGAVLFCVMLGPWLPVAAVVMLPVWVWWRRRRRVAVAV